MEGTEKTLGSAGLFRSWLGQAFNGHLAVAPVVRAAVFVVAFSASAFAACTGSGTSASPYVCSSTDGGLLRTGATQQTPKSTIDTTSIPAGSKIQSITVSLTWNGDGEPNDWAFNLAGPSNATSLVFYSLIGGFNTFTGSVSFADGHTALQDAQMVAGTTYGGNIGSLTNTGDDQLTFASGSPSTLNYYEPFQGSLDNFASQFPTGMDPRGTWTLYGYVCCNNDGSAAGQGVSSWTLSIVLAAGTSTTTTVTTSANPILTPNTETLTATVTASTNPTIGTVNFEDNGTTITGCGAVTLGTSVPSGHAGATNAAVCLYAPSAEGTHNISAIYTDSTNVFATSTGTKGLQVDTPTTNPNPGQYCNVGPITNSGLSGAISNQYPSHIYVPNIGSVSSLSLTLQGVDAAGNAGNDLDGIDVLLVGPDGTQFAFMNDIDNQVNEQPITANNTTFTLSDTGSAFPFGGGLMAGGTYLPLALSPLGTWTASPTTGPIPAVTNANAASQLGHATFGSLFGGKNPNGTSGQPWSLYVVGAGSDVAESITGWCLNLVTSSGAATTTQLQSSENPSFVGDSVTFTATVKSSGNPVTSGTVTFEIDGVSVASGVTLNGSGQATYTAPATGAGSLTEATHTIQAFYSGVANTFNVSNNSLSQEVDTHTVVSNNNLTFCNPGGIAIPDLKGNSTPYPSRIFVTNVPGTISSMNGLSVNLKGFTMPEPETVDALLVGPPSNNPNLVFMSQLGGQGNSSCVGSNENPVSSLNLTFADSLIGVAPKCGPLGTGPYAPTTYRNEPFSFPSPAPSSPVFASTLGAGTFGTQFGGLVANGTWELFSIQDETQTSNPDNKGSFSQWCVNFTINPPVAAVTLLDNGPFNQGQQGATYTVTVTNQGPGSSGDTSGTNPVKVTDVLPAGLTPAATPGSGTDWTCTSSGQTITCTSSDFLAATTVYPTLTLNVNVASNAGSPVMNHVTVTGGGFASTDSNTTSTTVVPAPLLQVTKTHPGTFTQGQTAEWDISVKNGAASGNTIGTVTVSDTLPTGYTVNAFTGTDGTWSCSGATQTAQCTNMQHIPGGSSFTLIKIIVNVPAASPNPVSNTASAWGGGDPNHATSGTAATGTDANVPVVQVPTQIVITPATINQSATVGTAFTPLKITVEDAGNNPVGAGVSVTFTAPSTGASGLFTGNSSNTITLMTAADGTISAPFTANNIAGAYNVGLTSGGIGSIGFSLTNTPGAAATVTATSGGGQSTVVTTQFANPLVVTVTDAFGNVVPGVEVTFTPPSSGASCTAVQTASPFLRGPVNRTGPVQRQDPARPAPRIVGGATVITDPAGEAAALCTANATAGNYNVTAATGMATSASFSLTNIPAATLTITKSHPGTFTQGQTAEWDVTVGNSATGSTTSGMTTVQDTLPTGYTVNAFTGTSATWTCTGQTTQTASCTSTQPIMGGNTFLPIKIIVNVPGNSPTMVTNTAVAFGGGDLVHTNSATGVNGSDTNVPVVQVPTQMAANINTTPQSATVGTAFGTALGVTVKDAGNNPVSGVMVTFTAPTGSGIATGTFTGSLTFVTVSTNASGVATAPTFTANGVAGGPYTVTATAAALTTVNFSLTNVVGPAATVTATSGGGQSAVVTAQFTNPLVVTVTDAFGNVVSGAAVLFSPPASGASCTAVQTVSPLLRGPVNRTGPVQRQDPARPAPRIVGGATVNTDAAGEAAVLCTANATAGSYNVNAATGAATSANFSLTNIPAATLTVTKSHSVTFTQGQTAEWDVTVGNSATGSTTSGTTTVQDTLPTGYTVNAFTGTSATWTCTGQTTQTASCTSTTGIAGGSSFLPIKIIVNVPGTSPTTVTNTAAAFGGGDLVHTNSGSAVTGSDTNVPVVQVPTQMAANMNTTPQSATVGMAFGTALGVTVKDAGNNPVSGVMVTFTAPTGSGIATGTFTGSLTSVTISTNSSGVATAPTFTANGVAGGYTVSATAAGLTTVNFSLTNNPGTAASISITGGNNQSAPINTLFTNPLQIVVKDSFGNGVAAGVSVTFTAPSSAASGKFANSSNVTTLMTALGGTISTPFTSNSTVGAYNVTLASAGVSSPPSFSLTNTPGPPSSITITSGTPQSVAIGTAFAPLQIVVKDAGSNPVGAGVNVTFTAPSTGASGTFANSSNTITLQTLANGTISAPFTANLSGGTYMVTLVAAGVSSPPSFTLTNVAANVSAQVSVTETGFARNRSTGLWGATMTVTNTGSTTITSPVQVLMTNITGGVTMQNNTGTSGGVPFITVTSGTLAPGASVSVIIQFANPSNGFISFTPLTYAGGLQTP